MKFKHLSEKFFEDYPPEKYPEMMPKENRPYTQVITDVNGLKFAIPLSRTSLMEPMCYGQTNLKNTDLILPRQC